MPRPQMPQIPGTDTSLGRKRNLGMVGCGFRNAVSEACGQGWPLLSQVLLAGGPFLSPAHCPMRGGEPEVISSDSAAIRGAPLGKAPPCGTGLFAGQPPCHPTQSRHCAETRKGHCGPDNELGRSHLVWNSALLGQLCPMLCFYPSLENGG